MRMQAFRCYTTEDEWHGLPLGKEKAPMGRETEEGRVKMINFDLDYVWLERVEI